MQVSSTAHGQAILGPLDTEPWIMGTCFAADPSCGGPTPSATTVAPSSEPNSHSRLKEASL